jgi:hypothetical protein
MAFYPQAYVENSRLKDVSVASVDRHSLPENREDWNHREAVKTSRNEFKSVINDKVWKKGSEEEKTL